MTDDFKRDERFYRYAQLATAYSFTKGMFEAGVDTALLVDVNWLANTEWASLMERFENLMADTPANTRKELADLEYSDLVTEFSDLEAKINEFIEYEEEEQ